MIEKIEIGKEYTVNEDYSKVFTVMDVFESTVFCRYKGLGQCVCMFDKVKFKEIAKAHSAYRDFKTDDKVLVWDNLVNDKLKRYFSHVGADGKAYVFMNGSTSWSAKETFPWGNCIKAEE